MKIYSELRDYEELAGEKAYVGYRCTVTEHEFMLGIRWWRRERKAIHHLALGYASDFWEDTLEDLPTRLVVQMQRYRILQKLVAGPAEQPAVEKGQSHA